MDARRLTTLGMFEPICRRHYHVQIEGVKLAGESSNKQLEAELANLKRDAAQAAAAHKQAMASWHIELDLQKAEVSCSLLLALSSSLLRLRATSSTAELHWHPSTHCAVNLRQPAATMKPFYG